MYSNAYTRLRDQELAKSTKPFQAKGKSVKRCRDCQMGEFACMCEWRPIADSVQSGPQEASVEFVLLMHRKELFKPTNTGRLIVDVFPNTRVYLWNRLEAPEELKELLRDPQRECFVVFPGEDSVENPRKVVQSLPATAKKITLIVLDGTWKQCSRMVGLSRWLDGTPCLSLPKTLVKSYAVRDSGRSDRFSTAEAAISCLVLAGEEKPADMLRHYFNIFNQHYLATRGLRTSEPGESHNALQALLEKYRGGEGA
ncbi:tRNA-uridine aminocarboxypropyltransferase [Microbulbifer sp. ALW1]|uniref:tRNA-uridine aminocarboxypropyltransferase n=1 Tax=Microbulbifer sp. (strain ALW1) TaxID=1516059 RepID=UPI001359C82B|nr:DTW domain-containing protein [Microbulbifer sp. ALW1]